MSVLRKTKIALLSTTLLLGAAAIPSFGQNAPDNGGNNNNGGGGGGGGGGNNNNGGGGGGRGGRGGWDPAQMMQRMEQRLQEELGMSDDEFTAIKPNVEKLAQIQFATGGMGRGGPGGGRGRGGPGGGGGGGNGGNGGGGNGGGGNGGGGNGGGGGGDAATSPIKVDPAVATLQEKQKDLQTTLDNKDASADDIKTKLQAFRDAKAALKTETSKTQEDLKGMLTQRQEAVLVQRGMVE